MDNAPPVEYPIGGTRIPLFLVFAVWALALLVVAMLAIKVPAHAASMVWVGALVAVLALIAFAATLRARPGVLCWDGKSWTCVHSGRAVAGRLVVALDLQRLLLLRFRSDAGGTTWCWMILTAPASRWDALRRAVFSGAP